MIKNYKLASLTGLLALCSGLYAMEKRNGESKKQFALRSLVTKMKGDVGSIIRTINLFSLDPNEIVPDILTDSKNSKKHQTSILGHVICNLYKSMNNRLYESLTYEGKIVGIPCSRGPYGDYWVGTDIKQANKVIPIQKCDKDILEFLFDRKGNLNVVMPCNETNCINPKKALEITMGEEAFLRKIKSMIYSKKIVVKRPKSGHFVNIENLENMTCRKDWGISSSIIPNFKKILLQKYDDFIIGVEKLALDCKTQK